MQSLERESPMAILLSWVARARSIAAKSYRGAAEEWLIASHAPERALRIVKAPTGAGSTI